MMKISWRTTNAKGIVEMHGNFVHVYELDSEFVEQVKI